MAGEFRGEIMNLTAADGHKVCVYFWDKVSKPRAVIQIFHGMGEHAARYDRFAQVMNSQGIIVFGDDHRGHGKTAEMNGKPGVIGKDGFNKIVEDEYMLTRSIKEKHPGLPVYVFAHSFGSFIGQEYIIRYGREIDGIILCGSAAQRGLEFRFGKALAAVLMKIFGEDEKANLLEKMSFGTYNKRVDTSDQTNWLSRDAEEVRKYKEDTLCGFTCSLGFYYYFIDGLNQLYKKVRLESIPKRLPINIIAGQEDPVGHYGKRVEKLYKIYQALGISDLKIKLYPECRHELLNEKNRDEITGDILKWINQHI